LIHIILVSDFAGFITAKFVVEIDLLRRVAARALAATPVICFC
jgi:hypothetical protein